MRHLAGIVFYSWSPHESSIAQHIAFCVEAVDQEGAVLYVFISRHPLGCLFFCDGLEAGQLLGGQEDCLVFFP